MMGIQASYEKACCSCRIIKPFCEFHNNKRTLDGKQGKCIQCTNEYSKQYRRNNRAKLLAKRDYTCKKYQAACEVRAAVRRGDLIKPEQCETCHKESKVIGHHDDYDYPLTVRWLCFTCHGAWHSEHGEALNARYEW